MPDDGTGPPASALPLTPLDEAGHYERPRPPRGLTAWDIANLTPPDTLTPDSPIRHQPLMLSSARDPDTLTWNPPVWPGQDPPEQPCWRAEETTSGLTITVAITTDGHITRAWTSEPARTSTDAPPLPAMVQHFAAMCHARKAKGITFDVTEAPGHYLGTITTGRTQVTIAFSRRHRRWEIAAILATRDGKLLDTVSTLHDVIRLLSTHEIGTGVSSPTGPARLPRNSAIEAKKNTVIRV